jgi:hypothetical protein
VCDIFSANVSDPSCILETNLHHSLVYRRTNPNAGSLVPSYAIAFYNPSSSLGASVVGTAELVWYT